jgi:hypothetical protein
MVDFEASKSVFSLVMSWLRFIPLLRCLLVFVAVVLVAPPARAAQQGKWEIIDNSFLVEESFNQERDVFQNIFTWTQVNSRSWVATFTQEWPVPGVKHQLSYTVPFARVEGGGTLADVLINYRYQLTEEAARRPAVSPRFSVVLPTGRSSGDADGHAGIEFNIPASKQFGDFYVHGNAGMRWLPDVDRFGFVAISGIWRTTPMFNLMLEAVGVADSWTLSPGFRRAWNFGDHQIVVGLAAPITRARGSTDAAALSYFSYELPFR